MKAFIMGCRSVFILLAGILFLAEGCGRPSSHENANVIVIVIDALRRDHIGAYGSGKGLSPHMDQFAEEGFRFHNAVAPCSWTKPSIASLMTGLYPSHHGAVGTHRNLMSLIALNEQFTTLAERLSKEGYRTAALITNPVLIPHFGFDQGFQEFTQPAGDAKELLNRASQWIDAREEGEKFFLYLHLIDPHAPYFPPDEYRKKHVQCDPGEKTIKTWTGDPLEIEAWVLQYHRWKMKDTAGRFRFDFEQLYYDLGGEGTVNGELDSSGIKKRLYLDFSGPEDSELQKRIEYLVRLYEGEVAYTNDSLDAFFKALEGKGVLGNSLVAITADHGEAFLEHGVWGHSLDVHAEQVNIPLIFRIPEDGGAIKGRCDEPVSLVDVYPTLLDMLGLPPPPDLDGVSLWPIIRQGDTSMLESRIVFSELVNQHEHNTAAVSPKGKLIRKRDMEGRVHWKYYDAKDPNESAPLDPLPSERNISAMKRGIESLLRDRWPAFEKEGEAKPIPVEVLEELMKMGY